MSSNVQEYYVIFDTNVLYHTYDKKADFSTFSFNGTYENVVGYINQLDIYERVTLVVPSVVWEEMERQIIEAHQTKIREFRDRVNKHHFPEIVLEDKGDINYSSYIHQVINTHKDNLSSNINSVIELPIASEARYQSIIQRAFEKRPLFEGKDKKSDKGFKDALLWESILEFASKHDTARILYYSQDNAFGDVLEAEFRKSYPNANLIICSSESAVKEHLESWAKQIDIYSYTPLESYTEHKEIVDWLQSGDFDIQIIDRDYGLVENSRLIDDSAVHLISFDNIQITNQTDDSTDYSVDAVLEIEYILKDGSNIKERIDVIISVTHMLNEVFSIEDVYRSDETESDDDDRE